MEKAEVPSIAAIKTTRTLLDVFQIVSTGNPVTKITAVWDTAEHPNRAIPKPMSDTQGLREFAAHKDSFLVFQREGEEYDIKLRPSACPVVLKQKPELRDFTISQKDIRDFSSDGVDSKGRKNRFVVFEANRSHLQNVVNQTVDAVEKLVNDRDMVDQVKNLYSSE